MEGIGDSLGKWSNLTENLDELQSEILKNPEISAFIETNNLSEDAVTRSMSKFYEYLKAPSNLTEGYRPVLTLNEGLADVSYQATESLLKKQAERQEAARISLVGLSKLLREATWESVTPQNATQAQLYDQVENFIASSDKRRGAYITGPYGIGKTYIMAAMANRLAKAGLETALIHYPTFVTDGTLEDIKNRASELKRAPILVFDDIGAESNNPWIRDNILQVMLQHRMDNALPTFFTSNLTLTMLENHLSESKNAFDELASKRVMERIYALATEIKLEGTNRRHGTVNH
ncbi:MAG: primosomal protein DnaI [Streptococcaceae bacterium]|jgi:primosomal protein DnaI|nr:primosomal protein DnaI [Streptococcaceae bacterium]